MATRVRRRVARTWGGKRPGAGRPTLFAGEREQLTIKITTTAVKMIDEAQAMLEKKHGSESNRSVAVEFLVRKGHSARRGSE